MKNEMKSEFFYSLHSQTEIRSKFWIWDDGYDSQGRDNEGLKAGVVDCSWN